ncbi:MAG: sulfatase-like hydrolase/transferase [Calditrichaeota bacterium]|nr:sulfatase-like hydrolase/transferase [Calditrichota bacterium]
MGTSDYTRRDFLKTAGLGAAALALPGCANVLVKHGSNKAPRKPNIIYILTDDLGYGDLGCYGQKRIRTPNLDRMAAEGIRFTDHYAGSTVCAPSRCALMTGLHMGHALVRGNREARPMGQYPLPADTTTVAKLLKQAGYATALIGKWGLGGPDSTGIPNRQGFDYFFGYLCQRHAHNYYPEFLFRNEERVPLSGNRVAEPRLDGAGFAVERAQYSHDLLAREALAFVERSRDNPFFLYLALTIPHANNEGGPKGMEVPSTEPYANEDWPEPQKGHAAMITRMDRDIGRLLAKIRELGLDEETLVIFTSDNGPHREGGTDPEFNDSNGPLRGIKRDLYEGGIRVPLIARWPGRIRPGDESDHVSAFWDFLPTVCEIAGVKPYEGTDGLSYLPALFGGEQKEHEFLYWEFKSIQAVRMGDWKGIRFGTKSKLELYDLKNDMGENNDIAGKHPDIVARIEACLKTARTDSEFWPVLETAG